MSRQIRFVDEAFREKIDELRMREYGNSRGFSVDLKTLRWKQSDSESYVLAALEDGEPMATMRGEVLQDRSLVERKLECPWDFPLRLELPVLLLSRAATSSQLRATGLNLVLRYHFLRFARHHGIPQVIGTFVAGSPRENSLREMGYRFFENQLGWQQSTYRSLGSVNVVALDMNEQGDQALRYCLAHAARGVAEYPCAEAFPPLRFTTCL